MKFKYYVFTLDGLWIFCESGYQTIEEAIDTIQCANLIERKTKSYSYKQRDGRYVYSPRDCGEDYFIVRYDKLVDEEIDEINFEEE